MNANSATLLRFAIQEVAGVTGTSGWSITPSVTDVGIRGLTAFVQLARQTWKR
jgi:hypothetical protein